MTYKIEKELYSCIKDENILLKSMDTFEQRVKNKKQKIERSIEWRRKKAIRDSKKVEDKTPWLPKNLTQKEMNEWSVRNVDTIIEIEKLFNDPCQQEQVLRELVILNREHGNWFKQYYRRSLKKYTDLSKDEIKRLIKDIERRNPKFFIV